MSGFVNYQKIVYRNHAVGCGDGMQAGVAMGLAKTVAVRFPEWGPDFATLMVRCLVLPAALLQCTAYDCVCNTTCMQWTVD